MKKLLSVILALGLLCGVAAPAGVLAAESLSDFVCAEESFSVKIPAGAAAVYEENNGLVIYTVNRGYIPYVVVSRRPPDMKFSNPTNYLNNVYREYLENRFGDNSLGMNPARSWDVGGKQLLGARYMYRIGDTVVTQLQLIDVRDGGDVEFTAKFYDGNEEVTMDALDAAVRYYQETDIAAPEPEPTAVQEPSGEAVKVVRPLDLSGTKPDTAGGTYCARLTDVDQIDRGGCFTVELYQEDQYLLSDVNALQPGDRVQVNGKLWTVASLAEAGDGRCEMYVREDTFSYFVFVRNSDTTCSILVDDWYPCSLLDSVKIMLPLPNAFFFVWAGGGEDMQIYDADAFIRLLRDGETASELNPYNTAVSFSEGLLTMVYHSDYPPGPGEEWNEKAAVETPAGTQNPEPAAGSGAVPSFLTPSEFISRFNAVMDGLLDGYSDMLGEAAVAVLKDQFSLSQTDPKGMLRYYGNQDWSLEAGFCFSGESVAQDTEPAILVTFTVKNSAPELIRSLAVYTFRMMIAYDFQEAVNQDALSEWFSTAEDSANVFRLPGYTLNVLVSDTCTQYALLPAQMTAVQP